MTGTSLSAAQLAIIRDMLLAPIERRIDEMAERAKELDQASSVLLAEKFMAQFTLVTARLDQTIEINNTMINSNNQRIIDLERHRHETTRDIDQLKTFRKIALGVASAIGSVIGALIYWGIGFLFDHKKMP